MDLDYCLGNPALGLAQFLIGLGGLDMSCPWRRRQRHVRRCQRMFLHAYLRKADPAVGEDLLFFYPLKLCEVWERHVQARPAFRTYLTWHYGDRLRRFLTAMSTPHAYRDVADLFA